METASWFFLHNCMKKAGGFFFFFFFSFREDGLGVSGVPAKSTTDEVNCIELYKKFNFIKEPGRPQQGWGVAFMFLKQPFDCHLH